MEALLPIGGNIVHDGGFKRIWLQKAENSLENFLLPMMFCIPSDDRLAKIL